MPALGVSSRVTGSQPVPSAVSVPAESRESRGRASVSPCTKQGGWREGSLVQGSSPIPRQHLANRGAGFSRGRGPSAAPAVARDVTRACQGERVQAPRWGARLAAVAQGAGSCWITPGERSGVCSVGGQAVTPPSGTEIGMW